MKTIIVTPKQVKIQKRLLLMLSIIFMVVGIITIAMVIVNENYIQLFTLPLLIIFPFIFLRDKKLIKSIFFDNEGLYVGDENKDHFQKIPLENIRSISIGKFDFTYRLHLQNSVNGEKHIYFKYPGVWYPFSSKINNRVIYKLRNKIDECKKLKDSDYEDETQILNLTEV